MRLSRYVPAVPAPAPGVLDARQREVINRRHDKRAKVLRRAAVVRGDGHLGPLFDQLAHYAALTELRGDPANTLPFPSQARLAADLGRHEDTIGVQVRYAEERGYIILDPPIRRVEAMRVSA